MRWESRGMALPAFLEPDTAPVEYLVIDSAEVPSGN